MIKIKGSTWTSFQYAYNCIKCRAGEKKMIVNKTNQSKTNALCKQRSTNAIAEKIQMKKEEDQDN